MARPRVGIVGGSGLYTLGDGEPIEVETPWGNASLTFLRWGRRDVLFLPRHGADHAVPAHRINHRANVDALRAAKADYVLAVNNVGALRRDLAPGRWLIPHDFLDATREAPPTFFPTAAIHADMTDPYCPHARSGLIHAAGPAAVPQGVYAGTDGPRFESAAEVRALAQQGGDVVGMTGVPEVVLAREAGLCYGSLCWIGNRGAGLQGRLDAQRIALDLARQSRPLRRILRRAVDLLSATKRCDCTSRTRRARIAPPARGRR